MEAGLGCDDEDGGKRKVILGKEWGRIEGAVKDREEYRGWVREERKCR